MQNCLNARRIRVLKTEARVYETLSVNMMYLNCIIAEVFLSISVIVRGGYHIIFQFANITYRINAAHDCTGFDLINTITITILYCSYHIKKKKIKSQLSSLLHSKLRALNLL